MRKNELKRSWRQRDVSAWGSKKAQGALVSIYILHIKKAILIFIGFEAATLPFPHLVLLLVSESETSNLAGAEITDLNTSPNTHIQF